MSETPDSGNPGNSVPEQLQPLDESLRAIPEPAEALREAQVGWLERRGIDLASTPHLAMGRRELALFRNVPEDYIGDTRELYEIPQDDQDYCQYALVDVEPDDPSLPHQPLLMMVTEADFGTLIDPEVIAKDFQQPDSDPDGSPTPDRPNVAYHTVDIGETIAKSWKGLNEFATDLMRGKTEDPFSTAEGDIGIRAGGVAPDQKDAYVWTISPFARSVQLTLNEPHAYTSVCVVRGQRRPPANGQANRAQIENPTEVLRIEGENLRALQRVYGELYYEPDFALTEQHRRERDELFNGHLAGLISDAAADNRERAAYEAREQQSPPVLKAREHPLP